VLILIASYIYSLVQIRLLALVCSYSFVLISYSYTFVHIYIYIYAFAHIRVFRFVCSFCSASWLLRTLLQLELSSVLTSLELLCAGLLCCLNVAPCYDVTSNCEMRSAASSSTQTSSLSPAPAAPCKSKKRKLHSGNNARLWAGKAKRRRLFDATYVDVTARRSKHDPSAVVQQLALVDPMCMAERIYHTNPALLFGTGDACLDFWRKYRCLRPHHPVFENISEAELQWCVPFALHGDKGTGLANVPTLVLSWHPMLTFKMKTRAWLKRFLIGVAPNRKLAQNTFNELCSHVASLLCGFYDGQIISDVTGQQRRLRGVLICYKGDWEWKLQSLMLERFWSCKLVCHCCLATNGAPLDFANVSWSDAPWLATIGLVPRWPGRPPLTRIPGFVEETDRWDLLHVWYLGSGQVAVASTIVCAQESTHSCSAAIFMHFHAITVI
jgi:hypothetical protein